MRGCTMTLASLTESPNNTPAMTAQILELSPISFKNCTPFLRVGPAEALSLKLGSQGCVLVGSRQIIFGREVARLSCIRVSGCRGGRFLAFGVEPLG